MLQLLSLVCLLLDVLRRIGCVWKSPWFEGVLGFGALLLGSAERYAYIVSARLISATESIVGYCEWCVVAHVGYSDYSVIYSLRLLPSVCRS